MSKLDAQIERIRRLVEIDTTSRKSNLQLIVEVEQYLDTFGISSHLVYNEDRTKANLYAIVGPDVDGGTVLSGHTDVVPVDEQEWNSDPFVLVESDDKLFGRGTADMKSFCGIVLSLVPEMLAAGLKRPIILALSYDEEIGCLGAPSMIEEIRQRGSSIAAVIVGEPTNMKVVVGSKGSAVVKTRIKGHEAHSSQTNRGVSAVMAAADLIHEINGISEQLATAAESSSRFDPPHSTLCVNVIRGGTQANIMAGDCEFHWNVRAVPDAPADAIIERVNKHAERIEANIRGRSLQCSIISELFSNAPALMPHEGNKAVELTLALTAQKDTHLVSYAAEAGQFQQAGFDTVICGPGSIDQAHQPNEYITLGQVAEGTAFIRALISRLSVE